MKKCPTCQTGYPDSVLFCPGDGTALLVMGMLEAGTTIRRKYRILGEIGRGGMGVVYRAEHLLLKEERALKVISAQYASDARFVKRFLAEVLITRQLQHPNIVRIEDADETEDGQPFAVMEYVAGESLRQTLEREGALAPSRALYVAAQVCAGLTAAHQRGIIHRDLKPDNILLSPQPDGSELVKVVDFGIAKVKEAAGLSLPGITPTQPGVFVGTPQYASPEQALGRRGGELDGRTDLYSLGVVLYEMLTGQLPFTSDTPMGILLEHQERPFPDPHILKPELDLPAAAVAVTMKALTKDRNGRFASAEEMRVALERAGYALRRERPRPSPEPEPAETIPHVSPATPPPKLPVIPPPPPVEPERVPPVPKPAPQPTAPPIVSPLLPSSNRFRTVLSIVGATVIIGLIAAVFVGPYKSGSTTESTTELGRTDRPAVTGAAPASPTPGNVWVSPVDGREMAWIPPGRFLMGSPSSETDTGSDEMQHQVQISPGFWMDATEVTNEAYQKFILANPQWQKDRVDRRYHDGRYLEDWNGNDYPAGKGKHPVTWVSWYAALAYCEWAGKRLPTEAEWEYAARAGTTTAYWWGNTFDASRANNSSGTEAVGNERRKNPWGLFDMSGNVWEWCASRYAGYPYRAGDGRESPIQPGEGAAAVLRGGSWYVNERYLRSAVRHWLNPTFCKDVVGFRCAQ